MMLASSLAAESDDWPEPVDFPPSAFQHLPSQVPVAPQGGQSASEPISQTEKGSQKKLWPFKRKAASGKNDKIPPPTEAHIVKVGPKDPPAAPYPLLRLPMPIHSGQGVVASGFYLLRIRNHEGSTRQAELLQRNQPVMAMALTEVPSDETSGPITQADPRQPPRQVAEVRLTPDLKAIVFVWKQDKSRYESPPFPVATDQRPSLTF